MFNRGAHLPLQIENTPLKNLDVKTLEYWARSAFVLDKIYNGLGTNTFSIIRGLSYVTWVKLIRGRWCLVASSDKLQSRFTVYDGIGGLRAREKQDYYLDGPVLDGVVEDTPLGINIALSIGTR